ncbi:transporter substrate-binding domain-containing protein [Rhizobium sp. FY34]|uniref:substrate-binding periplasmic protein n=1 Tax=Rhizobium sp. FY34 TaxID=2562309 RepID=UPI001FEEAD85|nr:transporter substrate-binding domain-containing protein [Rhizobium sp. FY34]
MWHLVLALGMVLAPSFALSAEIRFATEPYPPFSFQNAEGKADGAGVKQVEAVMKAVGADIGYSIEVMPWARALALAEARPDHCVFATARTPEREARFQWVVPLLRDINVLVARQGSSVTATRLEEATGFTVGTQREDYSEALLRNAGFTKIDLSASFDITLAKLLGQRIELMAMSLPVYQKLLRDNVPVRLLTTLSAQDLGIACNKDIDTQLIARMQKALDALIASGEQARIQQSFGVPPVR